MTYASEEIRLQKIRENKHRYYIKNKIKRLEYHKFRARQTRLEIMESLGGVFCKHCGFDDLRALQIDHINGGGGQHRQLSRSRYAYNNFIKENLSLFQVLCANCNWIKRYENAEDSKSTVKTLDDTKN